MLTRFSITSDWPRVSAAIGALPLGHPAAAHITDSLRAAFPLPGESVRLGDIATAINVLKRAGGSAYQLAEQFEGFIRTMHPGCCDPNRRAGDVAVHHNAYLPTPQRLGNDVLAHDRLARSGFAERAAEIDSQAKADPTRKQRRA